MADTQLFKAFLFAILFELQCVLSCFLLLKYTFHKYISRFRNIRYCGPCMYILELSLSVMEHCDTLGLKMARARSQDWSAAR